MVTPTTDPEPSRPGHRADAGLGRHVGGAFVAQALGVGLQYLSAVLTTRILGAALYGTFSLGMTIAVALAFAAQCGLAPGVVPFLSRVRRDGPDAVYAVIGAARRSALVASTIAGAALLLAAPLAESALEHDGLGETLTLLAPYVVLGALLAVTAALLQGFMRVREQAWIQQVVVGGVTLAGLALVWRSNAGLTGVIAATLAATFVGLAVATVLLARVVGPPRPNPSAAPAPRPTRAMLAANWPIVGTGLLAFLMVWKDVVLVAAFREPEEVGVYAACARLAALVLLVHESVGPAFLSRLADLAVSDDRAGIRRLYGTTSRWALWAGLFLGGALLLARTPVLALFGRDFADGTQVLALLVLARVLTAASGFCGRFLTVTGHARLNLVNVTAVLTTNVLLALVLIPEHGSVGAAAATCASIALLHLAQTVEVWFLFRLHPWTTRSLAAFPAAGVAAALALPLGGVVAGPLGWVTPPAVFVVLTALAFWGGGATDEDRRSLARLFRRREGGD